METMIAYCGLDCEGCPIHRATLEPDRGKQQTMRLEIAGRLHTLYGMELVPEEVTDCDGCRATTGRLFSGCARCEIRKCAIGRSLTNCGECVDFACGKLLEIFETEPAAFTRLTSARGTRGPA